MQKILVTGGTGYIGSHTAVALIEAGYEVFIIDNLSNSHITVVDNIEKITGVRPHFTNVDMCDVGALRNFFDLSPEFDGAIHFAALKSVGESVQKPTEYYANNVGSLLNLVKIMQEKNIKNLIFSSSCTVYGNPDVLPVTEDSPIKTATSPYGNTKIIAEKILEDVANLEKLNTIALRYFNPIGAHSSGFLGELPQGVPNNLVPFLTRAGYNGQIFTVFGNDYATPDGTCIRDYIDILDLSLAHLAALHRALNTKQEKNFEVFNVGVGKGYSVLEMIKMFEKVSGVKLKYKIGKRREGDIMEIYADTTLANQKLGWQARETLENSLARAWAWQKTLSNTNE